MKTATKRKMTKKMMDMGKMVLITQAPKAVKGINRMIENVRHNDSSTSKRRGSTMLQNPVLCYVKEHPYQVMAVTTLVPIMAGAIGAINHIRKTA